MRIKGFLMTLAVVTAMVPVTAQAAVYSDITGHKDEVYITEYSSHGLVSGYEDNTFQPQKNISRYEAISIISRMVDSKYSDTVQLPYSDKDNIPAWVSDAVRNLYAAGIISTYDGNQINGNTHVTRAEMVRMLDKMMRTYDFDTDEIEVTKKTTTVAPSTTPAVTTVVNTIPHDILGYLTIDSIGIKK